MPKTPPGCTMLDSCIVENIILAIEPFVKSLRMFETCVLVNNDLYQKFISSLELQIKIDEWFKVTSVPFFISDLTLCSCELDNFPFKML